MWIVIIYVFMIMLTFFAECVAFSDDWKAADDIYLALMLALFFPLTWVALIFLGIYALAREVKRKR